MMSPTDEEAFCYECNEMRKLDIEWPPGVGFIADFHCHVCGSLLSTDEIM